MLPSDGLYGVGLFRHCRFGAMEFQEKGRRFPIVGLAIAIDRLQGQGVQQFAAGDGNA